MTLLKVSDPTVAACAAPTLPPLPPADPPPWERGPHTAPLPSWSDTAAWTAELVCDIAQVPPCTRAELLVTYGTADPVVLRDRFALADDVAAAERYAAEDNRMAA